MYNSIIEFIEKDTTKIEKITKDFLLAGNTLRFEEGLRDALIELVRNIYQECLESIEQEIRNSEFRKQSYYIEHKADKRSLLTTFGNIEIERAYYKEKATGERVYLLDSQEDAKELIYEAINNRDMGEVKRLLQKCSASAEAEGKRNEIQECIRYITNNWLGIMIRIDDGGAVWGCSAEGQISHVLDERLNL